MPLAKSETEGKAPVELFNVKSEQLEAAAIFPRESANSCPVVNVYGHDDEFAGASRLAVARFPPSA
jgi:hypothetical protein